MVTGQVSSIFWVLHSDLHEDKVNAALEYLSSMVASVEPLNQCGNGQRSNVNTLPLLERSFAKGKFHVRFKRRNGRVRVAVISLSLSLSLILCMCVQTVLCVDGFFFFFKYYSPSCYLINVLLIMNSV